MHGDLCNICDDETERQVLQDVWSENGGDGMIYHVEGWFEGDIEADSKEEAEGNFDAMDIEDMDIRVVYEVEEE